MKACVILHNMIVEDEGEMAEQSIDMNAIPGASIVLGKIGRKTLLKSVFCRRTLKNTVFSPTH